MKVQAFLKRNIICFIALIAVLVAGLFIPRLLTVTNLMSVGKQVSIIVIAAVGMTFAIITKGIDLSVSGTIACSAMISGVLALRGVNFIICFLVGLLVGAAAGLVNGFLVAEIKVPPFIATFVMAEIMTGIAMIACKGYSIGDFPDSFRFLGSSYLFGIPTSLFVMVIVVAIGAIILERTPLGNHTYALGGNEHTVVTIGISTKRILYFTYMFSGVCAAVAGILLSSQMNACHPEQGASYQLDCVAACVIGGANLMGGEGRVVFSMVGAFIIGLARNAMNLLGMHVFYQNLFIGAIVILVVALNTRAKLMSKAEL